jgi:hypothetical protein
MIALKKHFIALNLILIIIVSACNLEDLITDAENSNITAKSKINDVLSAAKSKFANDAQLSAIYGLNVSTKGEIDLLKPDKNAFVYVVQSDSEQSNEFYVPVFGSTPVRSPINFTSMLSLVENQTAKDILGNIFGTLSTVHIEPSVNYDDSPAIITTLLNRSDVQVFRSVNSGSKMDMFLIPSKSIDTTSVSNTADWIVNFYSETTSLVLWLHPGTMNGIVTKISD